MSPLVVLISSTLLVVSSACAPAPDPTEPPAPLSMDGFKVLPLTDDGDFSIDGTDGVLNVKNDGPGGGENTRVVVAEVGSPPDSVCATVEPVEGGLVDFVQPGVALHVRSEGGINTALTLTNNVYANARWAWNVHYMDSGSDENFVLLGSFKPAGFQRAGGPLPPLPWRVCARTVGDTLQGKVWKAGSADPAWGDPNFGGSIVIPQGLANGGESGVYAAHLRLGRVFKFGDIDHG